MIKKISFIGAGAMAEAIIAGILQQQILTKEQVFVTNKSDEQRLKILKDTYNIQCLTNKEKVVQGADIIVLSMKPQDVEIAIADIKSYISPDQLIVSVVAGVSTERINELLEQDIQIIRVMPNTSASVGESATALSLGTYANAEHLEKAEMLFKTIGQTVVVDEKDMHIVTAISGSGPAYIYYLVEAMELAAIDAGCDEETANKLIVQMIKGASRMLETSEKPAEQLRKEITSPEGTTEAGLKELASHNFQEAVQSCVEKARIRSVELGEKF